MFETIALHPSRVMASLLGVYLLCALSSLRERLSCSLRLPPLPLHGYPCGLLPLIPLLRFPLTLLLDATDGKALPSIWRFGKSVNRAHVKIDAACSCVNNICSRRPVIARVSNMSKKTSSAGTMPCCRIPCYVIIHTAILACVVSGGNLFSLDII